MKKKVSELKVGDLVTNGKGICTVGSVEIIESVPVTYKVIYEDIDKPKLYFDNQELEVLPASQEKPSKLRAKFVVSTISQHYPGYHTCINLVPVSPVDSEENRMFWNATPAGAISLTVSIDTAQYFTLGQEYYVDFIKA